MENRTEVEKTFFYSIIGLVIGAILGGLIPIIGHIIFTISMFFFIVGGISLLGR